MNPSRQGQGIRGPKSALTDFLAANNVSAVQIQEAYRRRQTREVERQNEDAQQTQEADPDTLASNEQDRAEEDEEEDEDEDDMEVDDTDDVQKTKRRKRQEQVAIDKIKKSKKLAKEKARLKRKAEEDDLELHTNAKSKIIPGQIDNCEECSKRFTVTAYTREGPNGGLLCTKCGKIQEDAKKKQPAAKKPSLPRSRRNKAQSNMMEGYAPTGTKSLRDTCIERVANSIEDIEDFGEIPPSLYDPLSGILSKRRIMNSRTIDLFLKPDNKRIVIYDAGELKTDDFMRIFQICPRLETLDLRLCGQLKNKVIDFIVERKIPLREVRLDACNLITDEKWQEFFGQLGLRLESLQISWLDIAMSNETIGAMVKNCASLKRLKIKTCFLMDNDTLGLLQGLKKLQHLSLEFLQPTKAASLTALVSNVGNDLRSLCLRSFVNADNTLLEAIGRTCRRLKKLVIVKNDCITDEAFAELFRNWSNPPLEQAIFTSCRDVNSNPSIPADGAVKNTTVGFSSAAFTALMKHSGRALKKLELVSCRTISHHALLSAFDGTKIYPELVDIDVSFVQRVDTTVVAGIFKSCPKLAKLTAFGCFDIVSLKIPRGVAVIGVPTWQEGLIQEGTEDFASM